LRDPQTNKIGYSDEQVEVHRVNYGIPLIEAETLNGAMFGLGF
jgi:acyl-homoserine lactone acylase PvdQ